MQCVATTVTPFLPSQGSADLFLRILSTVPQRPSLRTSTPAAGSGNILSASIFCCNIFCTVSLIHSFLPALSLKPSVGGIWMHPAVEALLGYAAGRICTERVCVAVNSADREGKLDGRGTRVGGTSRGPSFRLGLTV